MTPRDPSRSKNVKIAPKCMVCGVRILAGPRMRIGLASVHLDCTNRLRVPRGPAAPPREVSA